jgi:hypothetical protein
MIWGGESAAREGERKRILRSEEDRSTLHINTYEYNIIKPTKH